jgi:hypothetical protein
MMARVVFLRFYRTLLTAVNSSTWSALQFRWQILRYCRRRNSHTTLVVRNLVTVIRLLSPFRSLFTLLIVLNKVPKAVVPATVPAACIF